MSDRMTIVGPDSKPKYILSEDNTVTDLSEFCQCTDDNRPEEVDGEQRICLVCGLKIVTP